MSLQIHEGARYLFLSKRIGGIFTLTSTPEQALLLFRSSDGHSLVVERTQLEHQLVRGEAIRLGGFAGVETPQFKPDASTLFDLSPASRRGCEALRARKRRVARASAVIAYVASYDKDTEGFGNFSLFLNLNGD